MSLSRLIGIFLKGDVTGSGSSTVLNTVPHEKGGTNATTPSEAQFNFNPFFHDCFTVPVWRYPFATFGTSGLCMGDGATFVGNNKFVQTQFLVIGNSYGAGTGCIAINNGSNFGDKGAMVDWSIAIGKSALVKSLNRAGLGGTVVGYGNTLSNLNLTSGNHGGIFGWNNTVTTPKTGSGNAGMAVGDTCTVSEFSGWASGKEAVCRHFGGFVHAGGKQATAGDAQRGIYMMRAQTTNATQTSLTLDGSSKFLTLIDNQVMSIEGKVTAELSDHTKQAEWKFTARIFRGTGAASVELASSASPSPSTLTVGSFTLTPIYTKGSPSWACNIGPDTANGGLALKGTGEAGATINWLAKIETTEIVTNG